MEEMKAILNQVRIQMGRDYLETLTDRRTAECVLGLLEGSPETRKQAIKDLKARLQRT